jgi:hypothetical protein
VAGTIGEGFDGIVLAAVPGRFWQFEVLWSRGLEFDRSGSLKNSSLTLNFWYMYDIVEFLSGKLDWAVSRVTGGVLQVQRRGSTPLRLSLPVSLASV